VPVSPRESPSTSRRDALIFTCEHGGNRVPARYRSLFAGSERVLESHRGWDRGALVLARALARRLGAPLLAATTTRLLVDHNRTATHRGAFSGYVEGLSAEEKARMLDALYWPHRRAVERAVAREVRSGRRVVHVAVHSFTPVLRGVRRNADLGLLYDPARPGERVLCERWSRELRISRPELRVRLNYPYRGTSDGLTTALRREHAAASYIGIEIEMNQRLIGSALAGPRLAWLAARLAALMRRAATPR
jgi:predicted N-formylglutamate amidohydrolase